MSKSTPNGSQGPKSTPLGSKNDPQMTPKRRPWAPKTNTKRPLGTQMPRPYFETSFRPLDSLPRPGGLREAIKSAAPLHRSAAGGMRRVGSSIEAISTALRETGCAHGARSPKLAQPHACKHAYLQTCEHGHREHANPQTCKHAHNRTHMHTHAHTDTHTHTHTHQGTVAGLPAGQLDK